MPILIVIGYHRNVRACIRTRIGKKSIAKLKIGMQLLMGHIFCSVNDAVYKCCSLD